MGNSSSDPIEERCEVCGMEEAGLMDSISISDSDEAEAEREGDGETKGDG